MQLVNPPRRVTHVAIALFLLICILSIAQRSRVVPSFPHYSIPKSFSEFVRLPTSTSTSSDKGSISYDLDTPPTTGCEDLVNDLQQRLIQAYSKRLRGVRYVNIVGYPETENKGDAALYMGQQILLSMLGIDTMEVCEYTHANCNLTQFRARLEEKRPYSAIVTTGGGNFNSIYWHQVSRNRLAENFRDFSIRGFPQSVHMTDEGRIRQTKKAYGNHPDLHTAARDQPSYDWLVEAFGDMPGVECELLPDIAFMWGNRPDFRLNTKKTHDLLIVAREDREKVKDGAGSEGIPLGEGHLDLGGNVGNVTYRKVDWALVDTPNIYGPNAKSVSPKNNHKVPADLQSQDNANAREETGLTQLAYAKSLTGFELLASARFLIVDRLHAHILSTMMGIPHVLMESKTKKNINFHDAWTRDCRCTRVATNMDDALRVARLWFAEQDRL